MQRSGWVNHYGKKWMSKSIVLRSGQVNYCSKEWVGTLLCEELGEWNMQRNGPVNYCVKGAGE